MKISCRVSIRNIFPRSAHQFFYYFIRIAPTYVQNKKKPVVTLCCVVLCCVVLCCIMFCAALFVLCVELCGVVVLRCVVVGCVVLCF